LIADGIATGDAGQLRLIYGNYGTILRQDGSSLYFLTTASGDQYGTWTSARPIRINNSNGDTYFGNGALTVFNGGSTRVSGVLYPDGHKTRDLGVSGTGAWDNLYYDDGYNQGAPDWSDVDVLQVMREKKPMKKVAGAFDEMKVEAKRIELDPASLPLELTGYHQLKSDFDSGKSTQNPDQMTPQQYGIWTNGMETWNYQAIYNLIGLIDQVNSGVTVDNNQNVGINNTNPKYTLDVGGTLAAELPSKAAAGAVIRWNPKTGEFYQYASSQTLKDNITDLEIDSKKIYDLRPVSFTAKDDDSRNFGLIAEEVYQSLPELVTLDKNNNPFSVRYEDLSVLIVSEMKKNKPFINNISLNNSGDLDIVSDGQNQYVVKKISDGNIINQVGVFSELVVAKIKSGLIELQNLTARIVNVQEKISSPVIETQDLIASGTAELNEVAVNNIKPQDKDLTIALPDTPGVPNGPLARVIIKGLEGKTAATFDAAGNATFSGTVAANKIESKDASISGKLIAGEIESQTINNLGSSIQDLGSNVSSQSSTLNNLSSNINDIQQLLADIRSTPIPDPATSTDLSTVTDLTSIPTSTDSAQIFGSVTTAQLTVTDNANLYNASISNSLTAGNILIENDEILSLSWELKLSALSTINLFDGAVVIAKNGTITTTGTLIAQGGVKTNEISPINNEDNINIKLKSQMANNNSITNHKLQITNNGKEVASIDASGSAKFGNLIANSLSINNSATNSSVISASDNFIKNGLYSAAVETATASAGIATLPTNNQDVVIYNDTIKEGSLIYLTPTEQIPDGQLTVVKKETCKIQTVGCKKYFQVAISNITNKDLKFNWLIIN